MGWSSPNYTYTKIYKNLIEKKESIEEELKKALENVPSPEKESILKLLEDLDNARDEIFDVVDDELQETLDEKDDAEDELDSIKSERDEIEEELEGLKKSGLNLGGSLEDEMKMELVAVAMGKFTLTQLEEKLGGNKFTL